MIYGQDIDLRTEKSLTLGYVIDINQEFVNLLNDSEILAYNNQKLKDAEKRILKKYIS